MDVKALIRAVRAREPLWNRQHPQYNERDISVSLWEEVSKEIGVDVDSARYKWRGLRDTFRGELKKLNRTHLRNIKGDIDHTNWEYFQEMKFVKDQIYLNRRNSDQMIFRDDGFYNESLDLTSVCSAEVGEGNDRTIFNETEIHNNFACFSRKRSSESDGDSVSSHNFIRRRKLEDDNYSFLMSLLPQLKSLPVTRNLFIRLKIQEMLLDEILSLQKFHYSD